VYFNNSINNSSFSWYIYAGHVFEYMLRWTRIKTREN